MTDSEKLKLFFYRPQKDFKLEPKFCYLLVPLLFGTEIEKDYRIKIDPKDILFDGSADWRTDGMWKDYQFDPKLFDIVQFPEDADFFVFPYRLDEFIETSGIHGTVDFINSLPYFKSHEDRHIFMTNHDRSLPFHSGATFFRTSINRLLKDDHAVAIPYGVQDFAEYLHFDPLQITYHTNFVGFTGSSQIRVTLIESIKQQSGLITYLDAVDKFFGFLDPEKMGEQRNKFLNSMKDSWSVLCPRGAGENTFRFFEVMSMGRIPILIADTCLLPFEDEIDYDSFILRIPEADAAGAGSIIADWFSQQTEDDLIKKCKKSREVWERYFKCSEWNKNTIKLLLNIRSEIQKHEYLASLDQQALYLLGKGDADSAKEVLLEYIEKDSSRFEPFHNLALIFWENGDFESAIKYFEDALKISQYNRSVVLSYSDMLIDNEESSNARILFENYLKIHPDDAEIHLILQKTTTLKP